LILQKTIRKKITIEGIGLHSGTTVKLNILPAEDDTGILFCRSDLPVRQFIKGRADSVLDTRFATTIGNAEGRISTIEHLMSALHGLGVDNVIIEVDAPEIPIMDGSARPFVDELDRVGLAVGSKAKKFMAITKPVEVSEGDKFAAFYPGSNFSIDYSIDFTHPLIRSQNMELDFCTSVFRKQICEARTFGFLAEINALKAAGLAQGGSLDNAIIVGSMEILNKEGLRFSDEFVRHKVLDAVGDLMMLGASPLGHFVARKSGHDLNHKLVMATLADKSAYEMIELNYQPVAAARRRRSMAMPGQLQAS
jgi:UDP-3-O-[3-hydroxymyristoyl] N-acetylglucosamine deacetylase